MVRPLFPRQLAAVYAIAFWSWINIGLAQNGTGTVITFTDSGGATAARRFYHVVVSP